MLQEFVNDCLRTESSFQALTPQQSRMLHAALGLATEVEELAQCCDNVDYNSDKLDRVNFVEECGDFLWYLALAWDATDTTVFLNEDWVYSRLGKSGADSLRKTVARLRSYVEVHLSKLKAHIYYGREVGDFTAELRELYFYTAAVLMVGAGASLESCKRTVINKLKTRYPEKFTASAANSRNLEAERRLLESEVAKQG